MSLGVANTARGNPSWLAQGGCRRGANIKGPRAGRTTLKISTRQTRKHKEGKASSRQGKDNNEAGREKTTTKQAVVVW